MKEKIANEIMLYNRGVITQLDALIMAQSIINLLEEEGYGKMIKCSDFNPGCGENGSCPYGADKCTDEEEPKYFEPIKG